MWLQTLVSDNCYAKQELPIKQTQLLFPVFDTILHHFLRSSWLLTWLKMGMAVWTDWYALMNIMFKCLKWSYYLYKKNEIDLLPSDLE